MTKYTREQIDKAKHLADMAEKLATVNWADEFAKHLGIEVEDPKPEPGAWELTSHAVVIYHSHDGTRLAFDSNGHWRELGPKCFPTTRNRPARVVPAEPVELTEEQVGELWDGQRSMHLTGWAGLSSSYVASWTNTVNAALAKYAR